MDYQGPTANRRLHSRVFLWLVVAITAAFAWILQPYFGAVFWGAVLAVVFMPLNKRLLARLGPRPTLAALITLLLILVIVVLPLSMLTSSLLREGGAVLDQVRSGELSFSRWFNQIIGALPGWLTSWLDRFGLLDIHEVESKVRDAIVRGGQQLAVGAVSFGQNTLDFMIGLGVALYLAFFLLRDGVGLVDRVRRAIPLADSYKRRLGLKFSTVIRATVKGNVLVAVAQGALGGLAFWVLDIRAPLFWAVVMAFLSLLPAVGAGLVWVPVAIYLLLSGSLAHGIGLVAYGVLVIGMVDNVLRPLLVGKDTKMPDYVVLISTIGGMSVFGITGFVIGPAIAAMFIAVWDLFASQQEAARRRQLVEEAQMLRRDGRSGDAAAPAPLGDDNPA